MQEPALRPEVAAFFDAFVVAFRSFDGYHIAERYAVPYLACNRGPAFQCFLSHGDVGQYFQLVVDQYHAKGVRACRYKDLEVVAMGAQSVLGTVTWELLALDAETVLSGWRESYTLCRVDGRLKVIASVDHVI